LQNNYIFAVLKHKSGMCLGLPTQTSN